MKQSVYMVKVNKKRTETEVGVCLQIAFSPQEKCRHFVFYIKIKEMVCALLYRTKKNLGTSLLMVYNDIYMDKKPINLPLPEAIYKALVIQAKANGRSITQEAIIRLSRSLEVKYEFNDKRIRSDFGSFDK